MHARTLSITDFLTDGSLAALCESVGSITGTPVSLRDPEGRLIVTSKGKRPWRVAESESGGAVAVEDDVPAFVAPLTLSTGVIGALEIPSLRGEPEAGEERSREDVERFLTLQASIVSEICEREFQLQARVEELEVLRELSGLLVGATDTDALLQVAVKSAAEVLGADAGTVRALDESERLLVLRAWHGLSQDYVAASVAVSSDSIPDRASLDGEVVVTENLLAEVSAPNLEARRREGLVTMISAGLVFRGKAQGILRLFTKQARRYSASERGLFKAIAEQAAAALASARLLEAEKESIRVQRQMKLAADVQRRLLPRSTPRLPGLDVAARAIPSFELSGDFYDFLELGGNLGVVVGDVVGKGIAAALLMAAVRSSLRAYAQDVYHLDELVNRVNIAMCRDTLDNEFATLFYGVIDPQTLRLTYCNAGHEPAIVLHTAPGKAPTLADMSELTAGGMVVGIDPHQRYQRASFDLRPGDVLLAYTDGLADTMNFEGAKFGKRRVRQSLLDLLTHDPGASAERIADHLIWENRRFAGLNRRADDTTIVVVRVDGRNDADAAPPT